MPRLEEMPSSPNCKQVKKGSTRAASYVALKSWRIGSLNDDFSEVRFGGSSDVTFGCSMFVAFKVCVLSLGGAPH